MPHVSFEYSANLDGRVDIGALCKVIAKAALETGVYEVGGVRVRAIRCADYVVGDDLPENAFIDMSLRMGTGRSAEDKKRAGDHIFNTVATYLARLYETPHFALSLEIREIDPVFVWRKNGMHQRLRAK